METTLEKHHLSSQEQPWHLSDSAKNVLYVGTSWAAYIGVAGGLCAAEWYTLRTLHIHPAKLAIQAVQTMALMPLSNIVNAYSQLGWMPLIPKVVVTVLMAASIINKGMSIVTHWDANDWAEAGWQGLQYIRAGATMVVAAPFVVPHIVGSAASHLAHYGVAKMVDLLETASHDGVEFMPDMSWMNFPQKYDHFTPDELMYVVGGITGLAGAFYGMGRGGIVDAGTVAFTAGVMGASGAKGLYIVGTSNQPVLLMRVAAAAATASVVLATSAPQPQKWLYMAAIVAADLVGEQMLDAWLNPSDRGQHDSTYVQAPNSYPSLPYETNQMPEEHEAT